jgi:amidase
MSADLNAWCDYPERTVPSSPSGPLADKTLAVKDLYDVEGYPSGWGQPTRLAGAEPAAETQSAVQKLLDAGAQFAGKSQCDELCFSLNGVNAHYGAPVNPAAPARITGGSSSGSASLVAAGEVDIATASDTGGSVRAPASYCGLIGLRCTHGVIPLDRTMPLAPSFDVFGWFAKDAVTYEAVADILLPQDGSEAPLANPIASAGLDALMMGDGEHETHSASWAKLRPVFDADRDFVDLGIDFEAAYWTFRRTQAYEAWQALGSWIEEAKPDLGTGVADRFAFGHSVTDAEFKTESANRKAVTAALEKVIGGDGVLVLPTSPSCAPLKSSTDEELGAFREQALMLLCLSGLSGLPQITLPLGTIHGAPMGISLIGPRGSDRRLVAISRSVLG